jgi:hypothetical protein
MTTFFPPFETHARKAVTSKVSLRVITAIGLAATSFIGACGGGTVTPITGTTAFVPCGWIVEQKSDTEAFALLPRDDAHQDEYDGVAAFSIESLGSHQAALARLVQIATETSVAPTIGLSHGWPSLSRKYAARVEGDNERRIGARRGDWVAVTTAIAAGSRIVRVDARISPARDGEASGVMRMGLSFEVPTPRPDSGMDAEIADLKRRVTIAVPGRGQ